MWFKLLRVPHLSWVVGGLARSKKTMHLRYRLTSLLSSLLILRILNFLLVVSGVHDLTSHQVSCSLGPHATSGRQSSIRRFSVAVLRLHVLMVTSVGLLLLFFKSPVVLNDALGRPSDGLQVWIDSSLVAPLAAILLGIRPNLTQISPVIFHPILVEYLSRNISSVLFVDGELDRALLTKPRG